MFIHTYYGKGQNLINASQTYDTEQIRINLFIVWFPYMVVTVVKIESQPFSSAELQHFRTENTRSDYN
jgi:hypothetical protein